MHIKFKSLSFKNIGSYGASLTIIEFSKGINLISAKNGNGKSFIIDALSFCLFGKPFRDIKIEELINRRNKKDLFVSCIFTTDNKDEYQITRTLSPDSLTILKNNNESDLLSSKKLNQEELDKILGINYNLFKQVIALAVNYNKPFITLTAAKKREIVEQIFNITVFGEMLKAAKKINTDNTIKHDKQIALLKIQKENLVILKKNYDNIQIANTTFEAKKQEEIKGLDSRIITNQNNTNNFNNIINKLKQDIESVSIDKLTTTINDIRDKMGLIIKEINNQEFSIKNNNKIIQNLQVDVICPRCNTKLTEEHKQQEISKLTTESEELKRELNNYNKQKTDILVILNDNETIKLNYEKNKANLESNNDKKRMLERELNNLQIDKQKIIDRKLEINIEQLMAEGVSKQNEFKALKTDHEELKQTIANYATVSEILSETGIKAFFFKKLLPILNTKINEYLTLFEIPIILLFDEFMDEKITNYQNIKEKISYSAYSEGEKKRIDVAILLSFISITKSISNWNCNTLIVDELLDGAVDESGLEKMVTSLKNMTYDSDLCCYIISHRLQQDYSSKFNQCLQITKDDGFSKINYI